MVVKVLVLSRHSGVCGETWWESYRSQGGTIPGRMWLMQLRRLCQRRRSGAHTLECSALLKLFKICANLG